MGRQLNERKRNQMLAGRLTATEHPAKESTPGMCECGLPITDPSHQPALNFRPDPEQERRTAHAR